MNPPSRAYIEKWHDVMLSETLARYNSNSSITCLWLALVALLLVVNFLQDTTQTVAHHSKALNHQIPMSYTSAMTVCKLCHFVCKPFKELFLKPPTVLTNVGGKYYMIAKLSLSACKDKHFLFKFFLFLPL